MEYQSQSECPHTPSMVLFFHESSLHLVIQAVDPGGGLGLTMDHPEPHPGSSRPSLSLHTPLFTEPSVSGPRFGRYSSHAET